MIPTPATPHTVEGKHQCSEGPEQGAQVTGDARFELRTIEWIAAQGSGHCSI